MVGDYKTYLRIGKQIVSPGQCPIPKAMIPAVWTQHIGKKRTDRTIISSGCFCFASGHRFLFVDQPLYVHGYTAQNLSADAKKMDDSTYEFIHVLEEEKVMDPKDIRLFAADDLL